VLPVRVRLGRVGVLGEVDHAYWTPGLERTWAQGQKLGAPWRGVLGPSSKQKDLNISLSWCSQPPPGSLHLGKLSPTQTV
jgi:hypothetical protein